ncbi:MAG: type II toxin-antitoxin system YafQ family toxin [Clostridia bacterium]|nr:type II toxin-antitoxin system YafQ family toxin [Clostridia bacterium]
MTYEITYSASFKKHFKDLTENEKNQVKNKVEILAQNPYHPSLRTKRIQGTDNLFECSINMDIRIIWYYENDRLIMLIDIGHHDILKQY